MKKEDLDNIISLALEYNRIFRPLQRNDYCGCGSNIKYKKCCQRKYKTDDLILADMFFNNKVVSYDDAIRFIKLSDKSSIFESKKTI